MPTKHEVKRKFDLPDTLAVLEVELEVPTDDTNRASMSMHGFYYFIERELERVQPAVALLYDLQFHPMSVTQGSFHFEIKIEIKLKEQWKDIKKKVKGLVVLSTITAALALPGNIEKAAKDINIVLDKVQILLRNDQPQCPPTIHVKDIREPSKRDIFNKKGQSWDFTT